MKSASILSHENNPTLVNLPGTWPGKLNNNIHTVQQEDGTECFLHASKNPNISQLRKVMVICTDSFANYGIRYVLQDLSNLHFNQVNDLTNILTRAKSFNPDVIIMVPNTDLEKYQVFKAIITLRQQLSKARILVISPENDLLCHMAAFWQFSHLAATATPDALNRVIERILNMPVIKALHPFKLLTPQQWRTLSLISQGLKLCQVADIMHVSTKTIYTHKLRAMKRLGIQTRIQEAWMMDTVKSLNMQ